MSSSTGNKIPLDGLQFYVDGLNSKSITSGSSTWKDLSGNGYDMTLTGSTFSIEGGGSVYTDGLSNSDNIKNTSIFTPVGSTSYTVCVWVKIIGSTDIRYFWHGGYGYLLYVNGGGFRFYVRTASGDVQPSFPRVINEWVHVVGTYDGSNAKIYKNSVLQSSIAQTGGVISSGLDNTLLLGNRESQANFGENYVSKAMVYDRVLSDDEISTIYNAHKTQYN